jgi:hypothetical protein
MKFIVIIIILVIATSVASDAVDDNAAIMVYVTGFKI